MHLDTEVVTRVFFFLLMQSCWLCMILVVVLDKSYGIQYIYASIKSKENG